jgi:hypothetical protein
MNKICLFTVEKTIFRKYFFVIKNCFKIRLMIFENKPDSLTFAHLCPIV